MRFVNDRQRRAIFARLNKFAAAPMGMDNSPAVAVAQPEQAVVVVAPQPEAPRRKLSDMVVALWPEPKVTQTGEKVDLGNAFTNGIVGLWPELPSSGESNAPPTQVKVISQAGVSDVVVNAPSASGEPIVRTESGPSLAEPRKFNMVKALVDLWPDVPQRKEGEKPVVGGGIVGLWPERKDGKSLSDMVSGLVVGAWPDGGAIDGYGEALGNGVLKEWADVGDGKLDRKIDKQKL